MKNIWFNFWNCFVKLTGWPIQKLLFRTKILYEDKSVQSRCIRGAAVVISNHTSIYDYVVWLFVFFSRTLRVQMAELLFRKRLLGPLLRMLGGIYVDRNSNNFAFLAESEQILQRGGVVGVFPESRLPAAGEKRPLPFKPSAAYLALAANVPVIPVYTNGSYFSKNRTVVVIGKPLDATSLTRPELTERENITRVSDAMRNRILELEKILHERQS